MFRSIHILNQTILFERPPQNWAAFLQELHDLRQQQAVFAALPVTARTAKLNAFADRLAAQRNRLATMVSEEVGRCLRECEAELDKSVELIRYYARLAPELLAHKTIATQASLSQVRFEPLGVVLAAHGYPQAPRKGDAITGLPAAQEDAVVFHAGTAIRDGRTVTSGGRVLGVTALGDSVQQARRLAYAAAEKINFQNKHMRFDIGVK